ncbi:hypothetical protein LBMAG42_49410 [Deltaproteobacteria bacterium]|nr:hypothetical protein LBMAG42_49410 [Deltaproteobacteria bacterium]
MNMTESSAQATTQAQAQGGWFALGGGVIGVALLWTVRAFIPDAAWINVRYAEHLAAGLGPVWNAGGPAVEGFAAPLLVIGEAALRAVGLDPLVGARLAGVLSLLATVGMVWRQGRALFGPLSAGIGAFLVGSTPALALWGASGLETLPLTLLHTAILLDAARDDGGSPRRAGWMLALVPWLRPEGTLIAALLGTLVVFAAPTPRLRALPVFGPVFLSIFALAVLRFAVFGHLLPTSVGFRFGSDEPGETVRDILERVGPLLPFAVLAVARAPRPAGRLAIAVLAASALSLVSMDHLTDFGRHLLPVWPLACLLAGAGVVTLGGRSPVGAVVAAAGLTLGLAVLKTPHTATQTVAAFADRYQECKAEVRVQAAAYLRSELAPGETYGAVDAGLLSVQTGGANLDLMGHNDPNFYETSGLSFRERAPVILASPPDWLLLRSDSVSGIFKPRYSIEIELEKLPAFEATYMHVNTISIPDCDYVLWVFWRP